ncbi:MAG: hypothetical protein DHS20C14_01180 [Phycisphaeraceae bacterium]|nr:MAG: hypothetical protein DHS20C14_01180 [Phycisphaeraceae bacterium]
MDRDRANRILTQQAESARFLGVDFIPIGAGAYADAPELVAAEPAPTHEEPGTPRGSGGRTPSAYVPIEIPEGELAAEQAQQLLDEVRARYERDAPHKHFVTDHHNIVFGEGDPRAGLMFVGEAPGETEDQTGRPFVGKAGQLLEKMIVAMGLSRERVYICNVLKTRPPNNQTPTLEEAELCAPYLLDQIRVVQPSVIVTLGLPATRLLLGVSDTMRALRGRFHEFPPQADGLGQGVYWKGAPVRTTQVMPTYHPAYLLRSYTPENRRKVWADLKLVMDRLAAEGTPADA